MAHELREVLTLHRKQQTGLKADLAVQQDPGVEKEQMQPSTPTHEVKKEEGEGGSVALGD